MKPKRMQLSRGYTRRLNRLRARRKETGRAAEKKHNKGLAGRAPFAEWFTANDIARDKKGNLRITFGGKYLGYGHFGSVYSGRIIFKNGSVQRVAVKFFHRSTKLSEQRAKEYAKVIEDLIEAGVPIPKMGIVGIRNPKTKEKEYAQLSQYFGKTNAKQISAYPSAINRVLNEGSHAQLNEIADICSKVINAGYYITPDFLYSIGMQHGTGSIPVDIDLLVEQRTETPVIYKRDEIINILKDWWKDVKSRTDKTKHDYFVERVFSGIRDQKTKAEMGKFFLCNQ